MFLRLAFWSSLTLVVTASNITVNRKSKRGLAFSAPDTPGDLLNANQSKSAISWVYDWGNIAPAYLANSNIEYMPMQWGSGNIQAFGDAVKIQGAKTILAFNEPDFISESNMEPADAAALWKQYIEPLKSSGIRLGGPAVTAMNTGRPWLVEFFAACRNCSIDFIPLHWYGEGTEGFYGYLWDVHSQFPSYPIWVTEYASTSTNITEVADFLNQTITYMDTLDWIENYAWFGFFRPRGDHIYNLLGVDGSLNTLGQIYVGAKTVHTQVITTSATKVYQTVNGADSPTQGLVTTYAAIANTALKHWNFLGHETRGQIWALLTTLIGCIVGVVWTLW